jgi:hypothetical protein
LTIKTVSTEQRFPLVGRPENHPDASGLVVMPSLFLATEKKRSVSQLSDPDYNRES